MRVAAPLDPEPTFFQKLRASPITFALALINCAVFLWAEQGGRSTTDTRTLLQFGAVEPIHVWAGEYWRVVTCMFLHVGWIHLLWNTYASIGWSTTIERALGKRRFLLVYLLSGIGGGCASVVGSMIFGPRVSAGASGAMFGIIGATLALRRRQLPSFAAFVADKGIRSTMITIAIWTAIGLTALNMDNSAHFGGLVVGLAVTWLLSSRAPAGARYGWLAFGAAFAALFVVAARPWGPPTAKGADNNLLAYAKGYILGNVLDEKGAVVAWPKNVDRGVRFLDKGCKQGLAPACRLLSEHIDQTGGPEGRARSEALRRRTCELDPAFCLQTH